MAGRIRSLKPEYLDEGAIVGLTDAARVLYLALWSLADDHGNARAVPKYLAVQAWQETAREPSIHALLDELGEAGLARLYDTPVGQHVHLVDWTTRWQRIDHPGNPRFPLPPPEVVSGTYVRSLGQSRDKVREPRKSSAVAPKASVPHPRDDEALVPSRPSRTRARSPISDHDPRSRSQNPLRCCSIRYHRASRRRRAGGVGPESPDRGDAPCLRRPAPPGALAGVVAPRRGLVPALTTRAP